MTRSRTKHSLTACATSGTCGVDHHFASFLFVHDQAQMQAAHRKQIECRTWAPPHLRPSGERVEIPYQGKTLAGILRKPAGIDRPPVAAMAVGPRFDQGGRRRTCEAPFLARGMATLIFEGPGRARRNMTSHPRRLRSAGEGRDGFGRKTGRSRRATRRHVGRSLGGYYAPRAAAFDKRIKACIALGGPFNWGAAWDGLPELTREAFRVRSHCKTQDEARNNASTLSLEGVAQNITCPLFIVNGRLDRIVPAKDAERLAREAKGPVELMMIEDGNHIATNRAYRWRSQSADWMAEQRHQ